MDNQETVSAETVKKNIPRGYDPGITPGNNLGVSFLDIFTRVRILPGTIGGLEMPFFDRSIDLAMMLGIGVWEANQMLMDAMYSMQDPSDVIAMAQAGCSARTIRQVIESGMLCKEAVRVQATAKAMNAEAVAMLSALAFPNEEKEKNDKPAIFLSDRERRRTMIRERMRREACESRPKKNCMHRKRCDSMRHLNVLLC